MLSDDIYEQIEKMLNLMIEYDYSKYYKEQIITGLAYLYQVQYKLDGSDPEKYNYISIEDSKKYINKLYQEKLSEKKI